MNEIIVLIASYAIAIPIIGTIVLFFRIPKALRLDMFRFYMIGGLLSLLFAFIAKHIYNDPRPFVTGHFTPLISHKADNGFPSDHTLLAAFLGFAALRYSSKYGYVFLTFALLIGSARVLAGVHHIVDIAGGLICAGVAVGIVYACSKPTHNLIR